jgi:hypothetical protein
MLKKNVGGLDRAIRIALGLGIISLAFWGPQTAWAWLGIIPVLTGLIGTCGLYTLLGISSCPLEKK